MNTQNMVEYSKLFDISQELKENVLRNFNRDFESVKVDIRILRDWLKETSGFKDIFSDNWLLNMLLINKMSLERSKQKISHFFVIRSKMPECFTLPTDEYNEKVAKMGNFIAIPKTTHDGTRILWGEAKKFDQLNTDIALPHVWNLLELLMNQAFYINCMVVLDFKDFPFKLISQLNPMTIKKAKFILDKVYTSRMHSINFINLPKFLENFATLVKIAFPPKLAKRVIIHENTDSFFEKLPAEAIPANYGGKGKSLDELQTTMSQMFRSDWKWFETLEKLKNFEVPENSVSLINDDFLGYYGQFRQIDFD